MLQTTTIIDVKTGKTLQVNELDYISEIKLELQQGNGNKYNSGWPYFIIAQCPYCHTRELWYVFVSSDKSILNIICSKCNKQKIEFKIR